MQPQTKRQPAKPLLDEQTFQQLLSAAYVMQQHNARLKKSPASAKPSLEVTRFPDPPAMVTPPVPREPESSPPDPTRAAGSSMQKNWSSLWEMHHTAEPTAKKEQTPIAKAQAGSDVEEDIDLFPADLEEIVEKYGQDEAALEQMPKKVPPVEKAPHRILEETALVTTQPKAVARAEQAPVEGTSSSPWVSAKRARAWLESLHTEKANRDWLKLQWQESRGNFYIVAAAFVLLVVTVQWLATPGPQSNASPRQLSPIEQFLVSMGVAEAPAVPQEYHGNPNTRVWVDVHTGLYYCPGAELYGKSKDGKATTQLDAQRDQFQPSTLKPCD